MAGILYLCATPIGNLEDMTFRAIDTLKKVDLIAAEDTRHSRRLLDHFDIKTRMTSYHEYNRVEKAKYLVELLEDGKNIAVITDAGTPGISDPGEVLVRLCHEAKIQVTSLPGACALINALVSSGQQTRRFAFEAFLPMDKKERKQILNRLEMEDRTIILYEAPHRLLRTLEELLAHLGNRSMTLCRELTKQYETIFLSDIKSIYAYYTENQIKGECVLVIEGKSLEEQKKEEEKNYLAMDLEDHMNLYLEKGHSKKDAMKQVAKDRGVGKRDIYQELLQKNKDHKS
ncbi:MAG: 16S rRNA (cytidine(1402)-2'-O)-methyltransferase [Anaerostipes sp.]|jgi:16S rRNA (cytidine1402-2'-O)-methyltransferase